MTTVGRKPTSRTVGLNPNTTQSCCLYRSPSSKLASLAVCRAYLGHFHEAPAMNKPRLSVPSWLREGCVIVASILLAFGIDAQWELSRERADAKVILELLESDFEITVTEAERVFANHAGGLNAAEQLITMAEEDALTAADASRVDRHLSVMMVSGASFDPPLGTVGSLIQSGRLSQIADPTLTAMLTAWPSEVEDLKQQEASVGGSFGQLYETLTTVGARMDWLVATDHVGADIGPLPWESHTTEAWKHLSDPNMRMALASYWLGMRFTVDSAKLRLERSKEILRVLQKARR